MVKEYALPFDFRERLGDAGIRTTEKSIKAVPQRFRSP